jgi:GH25 family lysozyme M1 (1,4-beta-N-acetylmuramidase)
MANSIGIGDASSNDTNKFTDWALAKSHGCKFGIVRATTTGAWVAGKPSIIQDTMFATNAQKMAAAGVKRMSYAWFDPRYQYVSAQAQAAAFLATLEKNGGPGELGPMIDLENAPASGIYAGTGIGAAIKIWLDLVEGALKIRPRIYTNMSYVGSYLFNAYVKEDWLTDYGLIIANWGVAAPWIPQPWGPLNWDAWQYRADAPGKYYGFYNANGPTYAAPNICLAVWNGKFS